jgi:hypothetical protein
MTFLRQGHITPCPRTSKYIQFIISNVRTCFNFAIIVVIDITTQFPSFILLKCGSFAPLLVTLLQP